MTICMNNNSNSHNINHLTTVPINYIINKMTKYLYLDKSLFKLLYLNLKCDLTCVFFSVKYCFKIGILVKF